MEDGTKGSSCKKSLNVKSGLTVLAGLILWEGWLCPDLTRGPVTLLLGCVGGHSAAASLWSKGFPPWCWHPGLPFSSFRDRWHSSHPQKPCQLETARRLKSLSHVPVCHCVLHLVPQSRKELVICLCKMLCPLVVFPQRCSFLLV